MDRRLQISMVCLCIIVATGLLLPNRGRSTAQAAPAPDDAVAPLVGQQPLGPFLGKPVQLVLEGEAGARQVTLEAADNTWVRVRLKDGSSWCYPIARVYSLLTGAEAKP
jgi:hypothetical protein